MLVPLRVATTGELSVRVPDRPVRIQLERVAELFLPAAINSDGNPGAIAGQDIALADRHQGGEDEQNFLILSVLMPLPR